MLNDHDHDKYEGHEESEYHFSEDDVNFEVEPETTKTETVAASETKPGLMSRLSRSKRMLISLAVLLALIFVAYKMITPTATAPATDLTSAPITAQNPKTIAPNQAMSQPATPAVTPQPNLVVQAEPASPQQPATPSSIESSPAMQMAQQLAESQKAAQPVANNAGPAVVQPNVATPPVNPTVSLPPVIPVQSLAPATTTTTTTIARENTSGVNTPTLTTESERLMGQLQVQYTQQLNNFAAQNKLLQDQIQALSSRVSTMENQLSQLVQVLTQRNQNNTMASPPEPVRQAPPALPPRIAYSVQAIIPGRAWLKSDNGETLTVAEGDVIKDVGRVTKIDPYNGIVEINTGAKVISLSYGNGG